MGWIAWNHGARRWGAALLAGLGVGLVGCSGGDPVAQRPLNLKQGVPVGAVLALSGNANVYGQDQRVGLQLALAHSEEDIDATIAAFRECFAAVA